MRVLTTATTMMVLSGIGYAFETEFWPLLIIALVGTLSPTASDVSVFAPLEQTLLSNAVVPQKRTSIFATYSLIGSVLSAVGCLFASAPEIVARTSLVPPNRALQGMFLVYTFLNKEHPFPDGCAGPDILCHGCRHTARAPRGGKRHSGAPKPGWGGKSSSRWLFARAFELWVAACNRRPQQPLRLAALIHVSQSPTARRASLNRCTR